MLLSFFQKRALTRSRQLAELAPLVIMSRGHSGTRVLAWICTRLGYHLGTSETNPHGDADKIFSAEIKRLGTLYHGTVSPDDVLPSDLRAFHVAVCAYYRGLHPPGDRWGWKLPETYLIAPLVARTFPRARYLHFLRDGRDVAFTQHLTDDPAREPGRGILAACHGLGLPRHVQAALSWAYQVEQFERFKQRVDPARVFTLRFEDLSADPAQAARDLCAFLGTTMTASCMAYLHEEVARAAAEQARPRDSVQLAEVEERIAPMLRRMGYLRRSEPPGEAVWQPRARPALSLIPDAVGA